MIRSNWWALAFLAVASGWCGTSTAATSMYLCVTDAGFAGDVTVVGYSGCSVVISSDLNAFLEGAMPTSRELRVQKPVDSSSNPLLGALAAGTTIAELKVRISSVGASPAEFRSIRLLNARVSSFAAPNAATDAALIDNVGFTFEKLETAFRKQNQSGQYLPWTYVCWNLVSHSVTSAACQ